VSAFPPPCAPFTAIVSTLEIVVEVHSELLVLVLVEEEANEEREDEDVVRVKFEKRATVWLP